MSLVCLTRVSDVLNRMNGRVAGGRHKNDSPRAPTVSTVRRRRQYATCYGLAKTCRDSRRLDTGN